MEDLQNPYAAPSAPPPLPAHAWVDDGTIKADPWIRLVARLIDGGLMMACMLPMLIAVAIDPHSKEPSPVQMAIMFIVPVAMLGLFVYQLVLLAQSSQTLGKRWMRIKIVRNDGSDASFGRIFGLRMLVVGLLEQVPCVGFIFAIVNACWIFGEESRCLHDLLADTKVVIV